MITAPLPPGAGLVELIVHDGHPTDCPRCGRPSPRVLVFARAVDQGRATLHCGCITDEERNGAPATQTFASEDVRRAAEAQVREVLRDAL